MPRGRRKGRRPTATSPRCRAGAGCLMAGTVLGLLLGVGTAFGLWLFGIEPPKDWRLAGASPSGVPAQKNPPVVQPGPGAGVSAGDHLKHGDFAKAVESFQG